MMNAILASRHAAVGLAIAGLTVALTPSAIEAQPVGSRLTDDVVPKRYEVRLRLDPAATTFRGVVTTDVDVKRETATIWLHAVDLNITSATVTARGVTQTAVVKAGVTGAAGQVGSGQSGSGQAGAGPAAPGSAGSAPAGQVGQIGLTVERPLRAGAARLHIEYEGKLSDTPGALFRVSDKSGAYIHSLFEPTAARRAIPCFDEPARLAIWQLEVEAPAGNVVLSNTSARTKSSMPDGWERVTFEPTPPLPSYLVSLAVGPLEASPVRVAGRNRIPLRVWTARGRIDRAEFAQRTAPEILDKLETYLSSAYPYRKLDLVAAPIGVGAVESPGLIRFREDVMLAAAPGGSSEAQQRLFVSVAAHEMSHMWFGTVVPMAWWSDIWFKESFASWMGQKLVEQAQPPLTSALGDALLRVDALLKDMLPSAKPLQVDVTENTDLLRTLYGAAPYEKGPLVVRTIETFLGERAFRDAVRKFLIANAGRPSGLPQFEAALRASAPNGGDAAAMLARFAAETGPPLVAMKLRCETGTPSSTPSDAPSGAPAGTSGTARSMSAAIVPNAAPVGAPVVTPRLELTVTRLVGRDAPATTAPGQWRVPFCVSYGDRESSWRQCTLLGREREEMVLSQATGCPAWVVPNDTADGYYVTDLDAGLVRPLGERIHSVPVSPKGLAVLLIDRQTLLPEGAGSLAGALDLARTLSTHNDPNVVLAAVELTRKAGTFIPASLRGPYRSFVQRVFGATAEAAIAQHIGGDAGASVVRCSSCDTTRLAPMLMAFAADEGDYPPMAAAARQMADKWLTDRASVPADLAPVALRVAGRFGDAQLHERLTAAFDSAAAPQRDWLLDALASAEDPASLTATIERASLSPAQLQRVFQVAARMPASRAAAFRYLGDHYDAVFARLPSGADTRLPGWFAASCQGDMKAPIENLFGPKLSADGKRRLERTLTEMTRCAATQQRYEASAREILRDQ